MDLSSAEIFLVVVVAICLIKPADLPYIIRSFKKLKKAMASWKQQLIKYIDFEDEVKLTKEEVEDMNRYLTEIISEEGEYNGEYDRESIISYYKKLKGK